MKAAAALPLLAALAAQAHPIHGDNKATANPTGICKFDRRSVLDTLSASNPPVSKRAAASAATTWDPPSSLATPLNEVWEHTMKTYGGDPLSFKNYGKSSIQIFPFNETHAIRFHLY